MQAEPAAGAAIAKPLPSQGSLPMSIVYEAVQVIASKARMADLHDFCKCSQHLQAIARAASKKREACFCTGDAYCRRTGPPGSPARAACQ